MVVRASDRFLVGAAQAGDLHAFEALVGRYQGAVYRVALRMLGSEVDAEDAAQEALVQAWRALSTFRGESEFSTWLYRIVTNRCLKARAARHPTEALPEVLIDRDSDPAEALVQSERLRALARGVLLHGIGQTPRYELFPAPVAGDGEAVVTVTAAALKPSDRSGAARSGKGSISPLDARTPGRGVS